MACQTLFTGEGGSCTTGLGLGNLVTYTLAGIWTMGSFSACGHSWVALYQNGVKHPDSNYLFYPPTATIAYAGCGNSVGKYDCVNGGCVNSATYSTPGIFATLAACQSGCAKNSTCTGECVSAEDLANLQQAAGIVQSRLCGS
jgi:hypothetical protein